ncbi:hypothetical protein VMD_08480 [Vibrio mimicus VM573]|nr:hypothetical protein VMD_08480 [Vibrio mimicus VM573]
MLFCARLTLLLPPIPHHFSFVHFLLFADFLHGIFLQCEILNRPIRSRVISMVNINHGLINGFGVKRMDYGTQQLIIMGVCRHRLTFLSVRRRGDSDGRWVSQSTHYFSAACLIRGVCRHCDWGYRTLLPWALLPLLSWCALSVTHQSVFSNGSPSSIRKTVSQPLYYSFYPRTAHGGLYVKWLCGFAASAVYDHRVDCYSAVDGAGFLRHLSIRQSGLVSSQ